MEFISLFLIPQQEDAIVEILQYVFTHMLYKQNTNLILSNIRLQGTDRSRLHFFFHTGEDILYAPGTPYWDIELNYDPSSSRHLYTGCPYRQEHFLLAFLNDLQKSCVPRQNAFPVLKRLHRLIQQIGKEMDFECEFCQTREKQLKDLEMERRLVEPFFHSLVDTDLENLSTILEPHQKNCEKILKQMRSPSIQEGFLEIVKTTFFNYKTQYESHLLKNLPLQDIYNGFKKTMMDRMMQLTPFVTYHEIQFKDWFRSLFLFQLDLKSPLPEDRSRAMLFCKKIVLLLYYLFQEKMERTLPGIIIVKDKKGKRRMSVSKENMKHLYDFHPVLRGSYLETFLKKKNSSKNR